ncbi:MAG TPA: cell division FtsA domain-containing protein [Symbiobacteriaceae bacterium]
MAEGLSLALDIGTRKVAGLLTVPSAKGLQILAAERLEHGARPMYDGQIHDVPAVAAVVREVVERLFARAGVRLKEAAVAAAGRALRTASGTASRELSGLVTLSRDDVLAVELEAVQAAQAAMAADRSWEEFHYVGHSVTAQRLDGVALTNLVGHRGRRVEVEVIATFLPRSVVDSLEAVLEEAGLQMSALTLEPIAALGVVVPPTMRHLNLALVDVGAGTSDIAITRKGAVVAYDMVPVAGDEITEALSEQYLLDFPTGERVKREIGRRREVRFTNILGQRRTVPALELIEALQPTVARLAETIAGRILHLNGGPPQAILLVGGGSLTPGLAEAVANAAGLPAERVAVRGRSAITGVTGASDLLKGPDAVTPIGIAVAARNRSTLGFQIVILNGRSVRLFYPGPATVGDALLAAGYRMRDLYGAIGKGLTVTVNGVLRILPGRFGGPPRIRVNGLEATLESPVKHQDRIEVEPGAPGLPGAGCVADVAPESRSGIQVSVNGENHTLLPRILINGVPGTPDTPLADNDRVEIFPVRTVADVLAALGLDARSDKGKGIRVTVNGEEVTLPVPSPRLYRNGQPASPEEPVADGDEITLEESGETSQPIFADLLARISLPLHPPTGKGMLVMRLNGLPADFTTPLQDGDQAEIAWQ